MTEYITEKQIELYNENGFIVAETLFDDEEMSLLLETAKADRAITQNAVSLEMVVAG